MRHSLVALFAVMMAGLLIGCVGMTRTVDLAAVARDTGLKNITTGDGTFENYTATSAVCAKDVGIAVGIPFIGKFIELFPMRSNEALLTTAANKAKGMGADAMINTCPAKETYWGIPFVFVGLYVDEAKGTGINTK
jgi:hypothetical protein